MFERLSVGWELAKQSVRVLRLDKELLVFPFVSGIACLLVLASFAVPLWYAGVLETVENEPTALTQDVLTYVVLFAFYFANYFVIIFFNTALVGCAIIRLKGGDPNVGDGFNAAMSRLPQIAAWAAVAATVGLVLKAIESRSERVGQIVTSLLGMAWSITTFFVVPVIVIEKANPVKAIKRSAAIMRKTWGESLAANFGIGFITFLLSMIGILPITAGGALIASEMAVLGVTLITLGIVWVLAVSLISSALGSIILAALYLYAAEGQVPREFDSSLIQRAFAQKH